MSRIVRMAVAQLGNHGFKSIQHVQIMFRTTFRSVAPPKFRSGRRECGPEHEQDCADGGSAAWEPWLQKHPACPDHVPDHIQICSATEVPIRAERMWSGT